MISEPCTISAVPTRDSIVSSSEYLADRIICLETNLDNLAHKLIGGGQGISDKSIAVSEEPPMIQHNKVMSSKVEDMINLVQNFNEIVG